ncbi:MAG: PH domain-containing protein [Pirellulaceae bacterium]|nr:PH domain-containing protein [Pirellulaceae bacterium]
MESSFDPATIQRPDRKLLTYYIFLSILAGPAFPLVLLSLYIRYSTLRYKFDADGVSMSHGLFFRREVNLTFRRLQDIHLTHNLLQRWMGLATISLQTASGNAGAEMAIEGVLQAEALRDFLYARMRGARDDRPGGIASTFARASASVVTDSVGTDSVVTASVVGQPTEVSNAMHSNEQTTALALQTLVEIRDALQILVNRQETRA